MWSVFKFAARAAIWRPTPNPPLVGLSALVGWTLVLALVRGVIQYLDAIPSPVLRDLVRDAIERWIDPEALRLTKIAEASEREVLTRIADGWEDA